MSRKLALKGKMFYGAGAAGWSMLDRVVITWLLYFYSTEAGGSPPLLAPAVFGAIMLLGRIIDAAADPLVAHWSDRHPGKRGRRTPFLMVGGVLYVLVFVALFHPPVGEKSLGSTLYLTLMLSSYFILFTVYVCPYLALLPELARDERDRVDLATFKAVFTLVGVGLAMVGSGLLIGSLGFGGMVLALAGAGLFFLTLPLFVREREHAAGKPATLGLVHAILTTLKNRAFRIYLVGNMAFWFGFNIITLGVPFYVTVLLGLTEEATALYFGAVFGVAALSFPFVNRYSKIWGLKRVMVLAMLIFVVILPLFYFIGRSFPLLGSEGFALLVLGAGGIPLAVLFVVPDAIVAAVSDLEEQLSGERREAMYFGAQGVALKVIMGLSAMLTGILLQLFGQTAANPLGVQLTGPAAAFFILIGLLVFLRYPEGDVRAGVLTHKRGGSSGGKGAGSYHP